MKKWIRIGIFVILCGVFIFSATKVVTTLLKYRESREFYQDAVDEFVTVNPSKPSSSARPSTSTKPSTPTDDEPHDVDPPDQQTPPSETLADLAPIAVDFEALHAINEDVVGWIYCEDTNINYPLLHGDDNDQYLHRTYKGDYLFSGSIFIECENSGDLTDGNTIIYGHSMLDGSMFGWLDYWEKQSYVDEHPEFWLITPTQDYRVEIISCYTTSAYSDTYTIFKGTGENLSAYIEKMVNQSVIDPPSQPEEDARYVVFSTCSDMFKNARFVVHGKLVPVDSAGGVLIEEE